MSDIVEEEERLRNLLSSIGHLSEHGDVPVYAYGTLISTAPPQAIAEQLHQRWLSDPNFARIAAKIVQQMSGNVTVCSQVLSLALHDFTARHEIRGQSRSMFRNYVRTLVEIYPVYRQIDKCLSACLIEPLFRCLQMLIEENPDDHDLHCVARVLIESAKQLHQLNRVECDRLILACRRWLCSNRVPLEEGTKKMLMNAIDLSTYSWDRELFPDFLRKYYEELDEEEKQRRHLSKPELMRQYSTVTCEIPSSSSQQMSDSASSSLASSAFGMSTQIKAKQSKISNATISDQIPNCSSASAILPPINGHMMKKQQKRSNGRAKTSRNGSSTVVLAEESEQIESVV